jgi:hypothetical protein
MQPSAGESKQRTTSGTSLMVLLAIAIGLVWYSWPQIRYEHRRQAEIGKGMHFKEQLMPKLKADPRFAQVEVAVSTGGHTDVVGYVDSTEAYEELKRLVASCRRKREVVVAVHYPQMAPDGELRMWPVSEVFAAGE